MRIVGLAFLSALLVGLAVAQDVVFVRTVDEVAEAPPVYVPESVSSGAGDPESHYEMPDVVGVTVTQAVLAIRDTAPEMEVLLFAEDFHALSPSTLDPELAERIVADTHPAAGESLDEGYAGLLVGIARFEFPDGHKAAPWWWPAHALQASDGADGPCLQCHSEGSCIQCHVEMANRYSVEPDGTYALEGEQGSTTDTLQDIATLEEAIRVALAESGLSVDVLDLSASLSGDVYVEVEVQDSLEAVTGAVRICAPAALQAAPTMTTLAIRCFAAGERLPFVAIAIDRDTIESTDWASVTTKTLAETVDSYRDLR